MSEKQKRASSISLDEFPADVGRQIKDFHDSLAMLKTHIQPLTECFEDVESAAETPLEQAQLNYTTCYALNSLFWMYLISIGENPQDHGITNEIGRLKASSVRLKELTDKDKLDNAIKPRVDAGAAKRFVKSALFDPAAVQSPSHRPPAAKKPRK